MKVTPEKEHAWLQRFVGEWKNFSEMSMAPDAPPIKCEGTEVVRPVGGIWIVAEGRGEMPGGDVHSTQFTVGYDPQKKKFVGTWLGSMMTYLWVYEGWLDADETVLTLETEGPDCMAGGPTTTMKKYRELVGMTPDGKRSFTSTMLQDDGSWKTLFEMSYERVK